MNALRNREKWIELVVALAIATAAAVALWAVGLAEVIWVPYFFVAVESARRPRCLPRLRMGARR
jgi:hypothetical protein